MPKAFSPQEKELLKDRLKEKGREYFAKYGLSKTSVSELTAAVGIAQGSFYSFFPSKEELYFEILEEEEKMLRDRYLSQIQGGDRVTKKDFQQFLLEIMEMVEENPFLKRLILEDELSVLLRKLPPQKIQRHMRNDAEVLQSFVQQWQQEGILVNKSIEAIAGVFQLLFILLAHKKELGESRYRQTLELLTELIAGGLVKEKGVVDRD